MLMSMEIIPFLNKLSAKTRWRISGVWNSGVPLYTVCKHDVFSYLRYKKGIKYQKAYQQRSLGYNEIFVLCS